MSYIKLGKKFVALAFLHISVLTWATPGRFLVNNDSVKTTGHLPIQETVGNLPNNFPT